VVDNVSVNNKKTLGDGDLVNLKFNQSSLSNVLIKIRYIYIYRGMLIEVSTHMYEYLGIYNVS
jgi:hypothetical protein